MIELTLLQCDWIQWDNIACKTIVSMCQILRDQGIPDQAWEMCKGREHVMSGHSFYAIANIGLPTQYYAMDTLWPNLPDMD